MALPLERHYLEQCELVKKDSFDPARQVGAIIVDRAGKSLASGVNAPPREVHIDRQTSLAAILRDPDWKYFMLEHAERNAIRNARDAGHKLEGGTIYSSLFPCADCARAIVAAGIKRVVAPVPGPELLCNEKWLISFRFAREIFELSDVCLEEIDLSSADVTSRPASALHDK